MKAFKYIYCPYSNTIRTTPENYWVCTPLGNGTIDWSDHDAMTADVDRKEVEKLWSSKAIPMQTSSAFSKLGRFIRELQQYKPWEQKGHEHLVEAAKIYRDMDMTEREGAWRAHNFIMGKELSVTTVENFTEKMSDTLKSTQE